MTTVKEVGIQNTNHTFFGVIAVEKEEIPQIKTKEKTQVSPEFYICYHIYGEGLTFFQVFQCDVDGPGFLAS